MPATQPVTHISRFRPVPRQHQFTLGFPDPKPLALFKPCACGGKCGTEVAVDGNGTALHASDNGIKVYFATEACKDVWLAMKAK